ncbi:AMP-binding enzyme family protein [Mycobacterium kansasii]|uniref:AMP-binding enzyme family protein n=1 Tax=Mycobacterium kansasii TaxID=1768 RepID=A0A1V3W9W9_MYCKA|nr:AMP-binding enzyme family protein [Mycobacterium kansasii]
MSSGDVGYLDQNGRLFVVGRDDEMIVSAARTSTRSRWRKRWRHPEVAEAR